MPAPAASLPRHPRWRERCSLQFDATLKLWVATGGALVDEVLGHPACRPSAASRLLAALCALPRDGGTIQPAWPRGTQRLHGLDQAVIALFEGILPSQVRELARTCAVCERPRREAVHEPASLWCYGVMVPARALGLLFGVPACDLDRFSGWACSRLPWQPGRAAPHPRQAGRRAAEDMVRYLSSLGAAPRSGPQALDLLTRLKALALRRPDLPHRPAITQLALLYCELHAATAALIGSTLTALRRHAELLQLTQSEPALLPMAVREVLRAEPPLASAYRLVVEDAVLAGEPVKAGDTVLLRLGQPHRQHEAASGAFDNIRLDRKRAKVLAFGAEPFASTGQMIAETIAAEVVHRLLVHGAEGWPVERPAGVRHGRI